MTELESYIFNYFGKLLTIYEKAAWKNIFTNEKSRNIEGTHQAEVMTKHWISTDPKVLALLSEGKEKFFENTVKRVIAESANEIFFNYCPKCQVLAKTPTAKQCAKCFFSWHETTD